MPRRVFRDAGRRLCDCTGGIAEDVAGSNPVIPTKKTQNALAVFCVFLLWHLSFTATSCEQSKGLALGEQGKTTECCFSAAKCIKQGVCLVECFETQADDYATAPAA